MKHIIYLFLLFVSLAFFACGNRKNDISSSPAKMDSLELAFRHMQILSDTDVLELKSYYITSFLSSDSLKGIMGYNYRLHSLDVINLDECRISSSIPMQREGPDGIPGRISSICPVSPDSVWVYDGIAMYLIDGRGHVCDKIHFENNRNVVINTNYAICTARFHYDQADASLLYLVDCDSFFVERYDVRKHCVTARYPLSYSVVNPERKHFYGDMDLPNVSFANNRIVYNYPYESGIYVLDMESGSQSVIDAGSLYTPNKADECEEQDYSAWERHRVENVHFFDVMYLPLSRTYARLHLGCVDFDSNQSLSSLQDSKSFYLSVFDEKFQTMRETKLPDRRYTLFTGWCALEDAILMFEDNSLADTVDYDHLCLDIIDWDNHNSSKKFQKQ